MCAAKHDGVDPWEKELDKWDELATVYDRHGQHTTEKEITVPRADRRNLGE